MKKVNPKTRLSRKDSVIGKISDSQKAPLVEIERFKTLYQTMVNESNIGFAVIDMSGRFLDFNAHFKEMVGFTDGELKSMTYHDLTPEQWRDEEERIVKESILNRGQSQIFEKEYRRKDGSIVPVEINGFVIRDEHGNPCGMWGLIKDITEKKRSENKLRDSEKNYRELFEILQEGIWVLDRNAATSIVNPRMAEMLGYSSEEMFGKSLYGFMDEPHKESARTYFQRFMDGFKERHDFEFIRRDGKPIFASVTGSPILDGSGQVKGTIAGVMDITERKKADDELRNSEERFSKAFINFPIPTVISDLETTRMIDGSESWFRLIGYSRKESVGRRVLDLGLWVDINLRQTLVKKLKAEGSLSEEPIQLMSKSGEGKDLLWSAELFELKNRKVFLSVLNDVSERNRIENEKKQLESQLQQAQKMEALGTLAGGIAHDFNNILGSICGYTEMTLQRDLPTGSRGRYNLEQVLKSGRRAKDLVDQILAFSRRQAPEKETLRLIPVVDEALKLMRASLPATVDIRKHFAAENDFVLGDSIQFHQIVMNLCMNAAYAMREAGGILDIRMENEDLDQKAAERIALKPGSYLRITVSDTGCGIPPQILPKIFEPFFSTKRNSEGTGLGLSVVYGIVQSCGGAVTVESEQDKGARFNLYFPVIKKPAEISLPRFSVDPMLPKGNERILFVDDEPTLTDLGKDMLNLLGYQVTAVTSSTEAFEIFQAQPERFDLVITDYTMPVLTGADLTQMILKIRPDIPVIMITGYSEVWTREAAQAMGIREIIMKPVFICDLAMTIRRVFGGLIA